jgi:2,3-bisphosphoglycerate-independent phosphoglycerate mutase
MGPIVLVVLDGWGISTNKVGNAILSAKTPNYNSLLAKFPHSQLIASGIEVGLPPGLMGNSEVGHLTIGAGRIVKQKLTIISEKIADGSFFTNPVLKKAITACAHTMEKVAQTIRVGSSASAEERPLEPTLHLIGLVSDGCVHSSLDHLDGLLELARRNHVGRTVIHPILDGRDTPPRSAFKFIKQLESKLQSNEQIGVVCGRYYAMDRDNRWERTEKYWRALVLADAPLASSALAQIENSYERNVSDEFIEPFIVTKYSIKAGDSAICFNFRPDRVRQISRALTQSNFNDFVRPLVHEIFYACMTEYDQSLNLPVAFDAQTMATADIIDTLPDILSCKHIGQFHTAETEKYAHVTYFFNGGREKPEEGEVRHMIPSLKVATYDLAPAMQTAEVCQSACQAARSGKYPFIVLNFANPDMVGHTGSLEAAVEAVQSVDEAFSNLLSVVQEVKGTLIITADHGNCEQMIDYTTGEPHTAHTTNPVPFVVANFQTEKKLSSTVKLSDGTLADVAPTILHILQINQPQSMSGRSLLQS